MIPSIITPENVGSTSIKSLREYVLANATQINAELLKQGAVLFRGFDITDAVAFEQLCLLLEPDLKNDYLGTSPRNLVKDTKFVFTASELPPHYPIMQHCEMSFLSTAPRKVFFYCTKPALVGGETPLCDFRQVALAMKPALKAVFENRPLKLILNYKALSVGTKKSVRQLKSWSEMFNTVDKKIVEQKAAENNIQVEWRKDDSLRLISNHNSFKQHPTSGETVWFNHLQVFHAAGASLEYAHIARRQKTMKAYGLSWYLKVNERLAKLNQRPDESAMHVTFSDGGKVPYAYIKEVQKLIWKNMYFLKWQKGDMVMIDNFSTSHGRMPYVGPREVLVTWSGN
jgi:alpha-ketoglutarate-dependent taurine dioxygenase